MPCFNLETVILEGLAFSLLVAFILFLVLFYNSCCSKASRPANSVHAPRPDGYILAPHVIVSF